MTVAAAVSHRPQDEEQLPFSRRQKRSEDVQPKRWEEASLAGADDNAPLLDDQVRAWSRKGFVLVDGLLPKELLIRCRDDCSRAEKARTGGTGGFSFGAFMFPCPGGLEVVNDVALQPRLIAACCQLLGTEDIRLTQADVHVKKGTAPPWGLWDAQDQRIHCDYPNHSIVHPPAWGEPECVSIIIYMNDVDECGGATALVPRQGPDDKNYIGPIITPGSGQIPWMNNREYTENYVAKEDPKLAANRATLYSREVHAKFRTGSVLLYRHDTWHRGTPLIEGKTRWAMNMVFKKPNTDWFTHWHEGWARHMYYPEVMDRSDPVPQHSTISKLIATATVKQRGVLGFPLPGHTYWTKGTLAAVKARYGHLGFDATPYEEALKKGDAACSGAQTPVDVEKLREENHTLRAELTRLRSLL